MLGYSSCLVLGVVLMCVGSSRGATIRFEQESSIEGWFSFCSYFVFVVVRQSDQIMHAPNNIII